MRQAFEVPFPDGTVHYFETGKRVATHAVVSMAEYGHMEDGKFVIDRIRWTSWRESGSERGARNAMATFAKDHANRIQAYSVKANDYRRYSDFRVVATRSVERHPPKRFKAKLPDGTTVVRVSQSSPISHLLVHFVEWGHKDESGNIVADRGEWVVHDPFTSEERAAERMKLVLGYDGINTPNEWHERGWIGHDNKWTRHSQHQIIPLEPVTPRKKATV